MGGQNQGKNAVAFAGLPILCQLLWD